MNLGLDLASNQIKGNSLASKNRTATENGTGIDLKEAEGPVTVVVSVGVVSGTSPTLDITLQESSDNSTFTALTMENAPAQITAAGVYIGTAMGRSKRYVRAVATIAGTGPNFQSSAVILSKDKSL